MQSIIIDIDVEGNAKVSVAGHKGKSCQDVTKQIEAALGKVTRDDKTPEYYQSAQTAQQVRR